MRDGVQQYILRCATIALVDDCLKLRCVREEAAKRVGCIFDCRFVEAFAHVVGLCKVWCVVTCALRRGLQPIGSIDCFCSRASSGFADHLGNLFHRLFDRRG
jgi:hypothetical protein